MPWGSLDSDVGPPLAGADMDAVAAGIVEIVICGLIAGPVVDDAAQGLKPERRAQPGRGAGAVGRHLVPLDGQSVDRPILAAAAEYGGLGAGRRDDDGQQEDRDQQRRYELEHSDLRMRVGAEGYLPSLIFLTPGVVPMHSDAVASSQSWYNVFWMRNRWARGQKPGLSPPAVENRLLSQLERRHDYHEVRRQMGRYAEQSRQGVLGGRQSSRRNRRSQQRQDRQTRIRSAPAGDCHLTHWR